MWKGCDAHHLLTCRDINDGFWYHVGCSTVLAVKALFMATCEEITNAVVLCLWFKPIRHEILNTFKIVFIKYSITMKNHFLKKSILTSHFPL